VKIDVRKFSEEFAKLLKSEECFPTNTLFKIYSIFFMNDDISGIDFDSFSLDDVEFASKAISDYATDEDLEYCEVFDPNADNPFHQYHQVNNVLWGDISNLPRKIDKIDYI
jgi:hypothetical protein